MRRSLRKLQLATERYQEDRQTVRQVQSMRLDSGSLSSLLASGKLERHVSADGFEMESRLAHQTVGLEQIVHMGILFLCSNTGHFVLLCDNVL